jgi:hypothetical protein
MFRIVSLLVVLACGQALRLGNPYKTPAKPKLSAMSNDTGSLGWDSHTAVQSIPESLVREIDGSESMRAKFEQLCRKSQVCISCNYSFHQHQHFLLIPYLCNHLSNY